MYITASAKKGYGAFYTIQQRSYPFSHAFIRFIRSVVDLSSRSGMDAFTTLGYIEDQLVFIGTTPHHDPTEHKVYFKLDVDDPEIESFYANSGMTSRDVTYSLMRLAMSLASVYSPSLTHLTYLINNLWRDDASPSKPQNVSYVDRRSVPETRTVVEQVVTQAPVIQTVKSPTIQTPEPEVKPKKRPAVKIKSKRDKEPDVSTVSDKMDALAERASALLEETRGETGQEVTTNPMLMDFLDM